MTEVRPLVRRTRRATAAAGLVLVGGLALATPGAYSDAAGPASCMAHEASSISPPGSSTEFPRGMPALTGFIRDNFPGVAPGAIVSSIAHLHAGSHEACDAALG